MATKITVLSSGGNETKALTYEQFRRSFGQRDGELQASPAGLARAYCASIWAYRAAQIRADAISSIPVQVVDASGDSLERHPLIDVFSDIQSDLLKRTELALCIWGDAFLEITRPLFGNQHGLHWLNPQAVTVLYSAAGIEQYQYLPQYGGMGLSFTPEDIVHMRTFNPHDDLRGLAPLAVALTSVGVERNLARHAQAFFGNGAVISGIVAVPGATDAMIDAVEAKWRRVMRGVGNFFKTLFLGGEGLTYTPVGAPPNTTRARLQDTIGDWIEAGEAFPALAERMQEIFDDPRRAEMIAVTEATRAYAEGNTQAWEAAGVPEREWRTAVDELVCPICGGLHQQRAKLGEPFPGNIKNPPAHPNCRCSLVPVVDPDRSPAPGVGQERIVVDGRELTVPIGYRPTLAQLVDRQHYTLLDEVRLTGERRAHYQTRHPETARLSMDEEEYLLMRALYEPAMRTSDPKNLRNERRYAQDENGKWWRVVVGLGDDGQWFVLTFQRVHGPGK